SSTTSSQTLMMRWWRRCAAGLTTRTMTPGATGWRAAGPSYTGGGMAASTAISMAMTRETSPRAALPTGSAPLRANRATRPRSDPARAQGYGLIQNADKTEKGFLHRHEREENDSLNFRGERFTRCAGDPHRTRRAV